MGLAIGQPLQEISETVLKKVNSKTIKSGHPKYNTEKKPYKVVVPKRDRSGHRVVGDVNEDL